MLSLIKLGFKIYNKGKHAKGRLSLLQKSEKENQKGMEEKRLAFTNSLIAEI